MIGCFMIAAFAGGSGWLYARMLGQRVEDSLRFEIAAITARCETLERLLEAKETQC